MGPEATDPALVVVPVACAETSSALASVVVERPAYSSATAPVFAVELGVMVIVGWVPLPAVMGADQTLSSALLAAL